MKIAIAQINPVIGDFDYNFHKIKSFSEAAAGMGCDLVVFSELAVTGYPPRDLLEKEEFINAGLSCLSRLVEGIRGIGVIVGYVARNRRSAGKPLFNAAALFENGRLIQTVYKRLLPTYDVFDERRYFEPGNDCSAFDHGGRRIGLCICEDAWNDEATVHKSLYSLDPVAELVADGADLLINISASPFHMGKEPSRTKMLRNISRKHRVPLLFSNQVGGNDSVLFDGVSAAFDEKGEPVARAKDFEEDLVTVNICPPGTPHRALSGISPDESNDTSPDLSSGISPDETNGISPDLSSNIPPGGTSGISFYTAPETRPPREIRSISTSKVESVYRALVMGTRDYAWKCGFKQAVMGLSGGIDSALTAAVATKALGAPNLLTVFMPSPYTSDKSREDAEKVALNLGVRFKVVPMDRIFTRFLEVLGGSAKAPGLVEENLQARIRGTILMAFSNRDGSLVLTTGNKSELAVGYCTLYGDMTGGLAVISDLPKTLAYAVCRHINVKREVIPRSILEKEPSAELKPGQSDRDELPPYDLLDPLLRAYVEEGKGIGELVEMGFDRKLVGDVVARVERNEYKRQQAAPGLRVTSKAFGCGRRYPIAHRYSPRNI